MIKIKLLVVILSILLTACSETKPKHGYEIRLSDGWYSEYFHCDSYEKTGRDLKCFDESGNVIREVFMPVNIRFTITKN